jgi:hypothetical protein
VRAYALALVAMIMVCGCAENPNIQANCDKLAKTAEKDQCFYNRSIGMLSAPVCTDIVNETLKAKCINEVAVRVLDYLACNQHDKMPAKDLCERLVSDARKEAKKANPNIKLP